MNTVQPITSLNVWETVIRFITMGKRSWILIAVLGGILYLPFLGNNGLWDPWETHYAEVSREMVESGNWMDPTWERSPNQDANKKYFFSKPPLILWMMAVPMQILGVHSENGGIVSGAEWYIRIPFVLFAILGLFSVYGLANRFFGPRVGLLAAVILGTCSQYYFIARQAMTDMPLVALTTAGMALLVNGSMARDKPHVGLLYLGYAVLGLAVLAKGLIGVFLPGMVFLTYLIVGRDWRLLQRMRVVTGGLLALAVAAPWYVYIVIKSAVVPLLDDEGKTFFGRFFLHDHLYRLGAGVHGDRGTFVYFIKQLGIGTLPWFPFMVWGGIRSAIRLDRQNLNREERVELLLLLWAIAGFVFYSLSITKFHHYALPILPALAILAALWLNRWANGEENPGRVLIPLVLILGVIMVTRDIGLMPKNLIDLFVYKYSRIFPKEEALLSQIGFSLIYGSMALSLAIIFLADIKVLSRWAPRILATGALVGAIWGGYYFFNAMGPHWSQRHLFDTYYTLRQENEPIGAYLMNWRGETFYSRNTVTQLKTNARLKSWLNQHKSKRKFLLVEQYRLQKLKDQLGPEQKSSLRILDRSCNKFYLLSVEAQAEAPPTPSAP